MATPKPNLRGLLSDSFQVIKSHPLHFLALAVLFIFPNVVLSIIYPFLVQQSLVPPSFHRSLLSVSSPQPQNGLFLNPFIFVILLLLFSLPTRASVTYTALHGYYGKPVKLLALLKSILFSFIPLLATLLVRGLVYGSIGAGLGFLAFLAYKSQSLVGIVAEYDGPYSLAFISMMGALLILALLYFQVQWFLSMVIVVAEGEWGFKPLKRSSDLVKGVRGIVLSTILLFLVPGSVLSLWFYSVMMSARSGGISWICVVTWILYAGVTTILSLYGNVVAMVLFAYGKAWHGEVDKVLGLEHSKLPVHEV